MATRQEMMDTDFAQLFAEIRNVVSPAEEGVDYEAHMRQVIDANNIVVLEAKSASLWDIYAAACKGAAEHEAGGHTN